MHTPEFSTFRRDINGLRAWAVIAVILYHFSVPGFGGGFIGVDAFFVVSGFLMTGIVVGQLERDGSKFSLLSFYLARARRILPALIALCAVVLALSWPVLLQADLRNLSSDVALSLAFLSNFKFWLEAGYFDAASHEKWLLHTWSLSVEWQFYLLLPVILLVVWRWRPDRTSVTQVMAAGFVASLLVCVALTPWWSSAAFYLLPARGWELLAGGLVNLLGQRWSPTLKQQRWLEAGGLAIITSMVVGLDSSPPWPGWRALLPVIGTVAVLLASRHDSILTGLPIAQWLGTRSYSLYLWHWPIMVALNGPDGQMPPEVIARGLVWTLVAGHLSYVMVERPSRTLLSRLRMRWIILTLCVAMLAVAGPGAAAYLRQGISDRFPSPAELAARETDNMNPRREACHAMKGVESPSCVYGGERLRAIMIGDSHANALVTGLAAAAPEADDGVMEWSYTSCPILLGFRFIDPTFNPECRTFLDWAVSKLAAMPKNIPIVIVNRSSVYAIGHNELTAHDQNQPSVYFSKPYEAASPEFLSEYAEHLIATACQFAKDRPVFLVRPIPEMGVDVPRTMARAIMQGKTDNVSISLADYYKRHFTVLAAQDAAHERCGASILDPLPYLCNGNRCHGAKDGRPLYYDDDHLSEFGNKMLIPMFGQVFEWSH
ncbi:acyltransferase family protein [Variovorax sp. J22R133]|uniref:acyltransferase family protein n=1 Tax=Variovorax brevis TaxID=3053503 RepID=UPI002574E8E5|nr:acyltransferase family protein [Variovorax sp. J22R133]MDM0115251.1 acyltransferase family protein [Variovorax sp. J22R133]